MSSTPESPSVRRSTWWLLAAAVGAVAVGLTALALATGPTLHAGCFAVNTCDGLAFEVAGRLLLSGQSPYPAEAHRAVLMEHYLAGEEPPFVLPFQYPPLSAPYFALRGLGPAVTTVLVAGATAGWLVIVAVLLRRRRMAPLWIAVAALWAPTIFNANLAQTGMLTALLCLGALAAWRPVPLLAGALLGLALFKPHYALPLLALAVFTGERRLLLGAALTAGATLAGTLVVWGPELWWSWADALGHRNLTAPFMVSWLGTWSRHIGSPGTVAILAVYAVSVGLACLLGALALRRGASIRSVGSWTLLVVLLGSPNTHPYDLALAVPGLALAVGDRPVPATLFALLALVGSYLAIRQRDAFVAALVVAVAILAWRGVQRYRDRASPTLHPAVADGLTPPGAP